MVGTLFFGAALQSWLGGPWLLLAGSMALGFRIASFQDERWGVYASLGGVILWFILHGIVYRPMSRISIGIEVAAFAVFVLSCLIARQVTRDRVRQEALRLEATRRTAGTGSSRLERLKQDSEALVTESEELTKLFGVTKQIGGVLRQEEVLDVLHETARTALRLPAYCLLLAQEGVIRIPAQRGFDEHLLGDAAFPAGAPSLASWCLRQREPLLVDNLLADARFAGALFPFRSMVVMPMMVRDEAVGALLAFDTVPRAFDRQDLARVSLLARQLSLGIGKSLLFSRIEELSITDGLTRLYRRRYFMERFDSELERARRYSRPLCLLMGDLDNFKSYNDTWGHLVGDEVLKMTSRVMESEFKRPAMNARYGGEEFAVLLPEMDREAATSLANRFREALAASRLAAGAVDAAAGGPARLPVTPVTISLGVAMFPEDAQTRRDLVARADEALYRAKREGKNRVCAWTADPA